MHRELKNVDIYPFNCQNQIYAGPYLVFPRRIRVFTHRIRFFIYDKLIAAFRLHTFPLLLAL